MLLREKVACFTHLQFLLWLILNLNFFAGHKTSMVDTQIMPGIDVTQIINDNYVFSLFLLLRTIILQDSFANFNRQKGSHFLCFRMVRNSGASHM